MLARAWLALPVLTLTAGMAGADPAAWRMTGPNGGEVTLLGSMHIMRPSDHPLPASVDNLIERADLIVMELDLDDVDAAAQQRVILAKAMFPQGTCRGRRRRRGLGAREQTTPSSRRSRLLGARAVVLAITLLDKVCASSAPGRARPREYVLARAQARRKNRRLETLEFQIGIFDSLPARSAAMLERRWRVDEARRLSQRSRIAQRRARRMSADCSTTSTSCRAFMNLGRRATMHGAGI